MLKLKNADFLPVEIPVKNRRILFVTSVKQRVRHPFWYNGSVSNIKLLHYFTKNFARTKKTISKIVIHWKHQHS